MDIMAQDKMKPSINGNRKESISMTVTIKMLPKILRFFARSTSILSNPFILLNTYNHKNNSHDNQRNSGVQQTGSN